MFCIFTYIEHKNQPNVGKYTIHGSYGWWYHVIDSSPFFAGQWESYILPSCRCRRGKCWITDFCEAKITLQWTNLPNLPMFNGKSTLKGSILQPAMLSYKSVTNRNILMIFVAQNEEFFPRGWSVRLEVYICLTHFILFMFTPNLGEMIPILTVAYVSNWVGLKPPNKHLGFSSNHPISNPNDPCMVYLPTFTIFYH